MFLSLSFVMCISMSSLKFRAKFSKPSNRHKLLPVAQTENAQWMPFVIIVKRSLWMTIVCIVFATNRLLLSSWFCSDSASTFQIAQSTKRANYTHRLGMSMCCIAKVLRLWRRFCQKGSLEGTARPCRVWWTPRILGLCIHDDLPQQQIYSFLYLLSPLFF